MASSEIGVLRGTPSQQVSAWNITISEIKRAQLDNAIVQCATAGQRGIQRFMDILRRADAAAARIGVAAREALLFADAADANIATINGIESLLSDGASPEDIARKLVTLRNRSGIRYLLDRIDLLDIKDTAPTRRTIDALVAQILQDSEKAALQENKEVAAQFGVSVQRNHNAAIDFLNQTSSHTFAATRPAQPQSFTGWAVLDASGNYSYPNGSSILAIENGMEQFEGQLTGPGVWQNAARLHR